MAKAAVAARGGAFLPRFAWLAWWPGDSWQGGGVRQAGRQVASCLLGLDRRFASHEIGEDKSCCLTARAGRWRENGKRFIQSD